MKILIAYDGSDSSLEALDDLHRAGLPPEAEVLVVTASGVALSGPPPAGGETTQGQEGGGRMIHSHVAARAYGETEERPRVRRRPECRQERQATDRRTHMDRRRISSNGAWRRAPLPPVSPVPPLAARWLRARYELSAFGVALACLMAAAGELAISHPPLLLLAAAVAVASSLFGLGPGLFALAVATLASDFFFVHPKNAFSFDQRSLGLGYYYALAGLISHLCVRRRRRGAEGRQ